ncbi:MAG: FecR domain-containing protein [Steroidobacter sp.]
MSTHSNGEATSRSCREAAVWYVRLQDPDLPARWWRHWEKWNAIPENRAAFDAIAAAMEKAGRLPKLEMPSAAELAAGLHNDPAPIAANEKRVDELFKRSGVRWALVAASCTFAIVLLLALAWISKRDDYTEMIATQAGEWRTLSLGDGSTVTLGPRTRIEVNFDRRHRLVEFAEGEAIFAVEKDPLRPFEVRTEFGMASAIGTRFGVSRVDREFTVTVAEGIVRVSPLDTSESSGRPIEIEAGRQVGISSDQMITEVRAVNPELELEWASKMLTFDGVTIAEALVKFNRRSHVRLLFTDPELAATIRIFGRFSIENPEPLASYIAAATRVRIERDQPNVLVLERASDPEEITVRPPG